jgi:hypothetical protein
MVLLGKKFKRSNMKCWHWGHRLAVACAVYLPVPLFENFGLTTKWVQLQH